MLRGAVILLGLVALIGGVAALAADKASPGWVFAFWGAVLVLGTVFERVVYKRLKRASPGPGWERTTERFVDDASGRIVTVYIAPKTGERAYVTE